MLIDMLDFFYKMLQGGVEWWFSRRDFMKYGLKPNMRKYKALLEEYKSLISRP